jgi:uncharacterized protein (DUF433 family)
VEACASHNLRAVGLGQLACLVAIVRHLAKLLEPSLSSRIQALLESPDQGSDILFQEARGNLMESVIVKNPKILGGTPVFRGTRVPLQLLFDSLERGHTLEEFLAGYPTVSREMAIAALEEAQQLLSART